MRDPIDPTYNGKSWRVRCTCKGKQKRSVHKRNRRRIKAVLRKEN